MKNQNDKIKNYGSFINEEFDANLDKINDMKKKYDELIKNYVSQGKASEEIRGMSNGGYDNGEQGYPIIFYVGDYCLVLGSGIYKKV